VREAEGEREELQGLLSKINEYVEKGVSQEQLKGLLSEVKMYRESKGVELGEALKGVENEREIGPLLTELGGDLPIAKYYNFGSKGIYMEYCAGGGTERPIADTEEDWTRRCFS